MVKTDVSKQVEISVSADDALWAVQAMRMRAEAYERTEEYLKTERFRGEPFEIEEVRDDREARDLAQSYRAVIKRFEQVMKTGADSAADRDSR